MDHKRRIQRLVRDLALIIACIFGMSVAAGSNDGGVMDLKHITAGDIPGLEREALAGDGAVALRLANYYDFVQLDYPRAMYWMQISAEDGSSIGQHNYAHMLADDQRASAMGQADPKTRELAKLRAKYWFKQSEKQGSP
jgi:hypothetical protein